MFKFMLSPVLSLLFSLSFLGVGAIPTPADVPETDLGIGDIINLLNLGLVTHINTIITAQSLTTNLVSVNFTVKNPLPIELTIDKVTADASLNGTTYAHFSQDFSGFVIPLFGETTSNTFGNVNLTQGALNSLGIIPEGKLDLAADINVRAATIGGKLGIPIPIDGLKQSGVPTTYEISLT